MKTIKLKENLIIIKKEVITKQISLYLQETLKKNKDYIRYFVLIQKLNRYFFIHQ